MVSFIEINPAVSRFYRKQTHTHTDRQTDTHKQTDRQTAQYFPTKTITIRSMTDCKNLGAKASRQLDLVESEIEEVGFRVLFVGVVWVTAELVGELSSRCGD